MGREPMYVRAFRPVAPPSVIVVVTALLAPLVSATPVLAATPARYSVQDLGTLAPTTSGSTTRSIAYAINDGGIVVGASLDAAAGGESSRAFRWSSAGGMVALVDGNQPGASAALDVGASGQAVGQDDVTDGALHAVAWSATGDQASIGSSSPLRASVGEAVNAGGTVVGLGVDAATSAERAFAWNPMSNQTTAVGVLGGGSTSRAFGVNDAGVVVGDSQVGGNVHAFVAGPGGPSPLPEGGASSSSALDINGGGQVVGSAGSRAAVWQQDPGSGAYVMQDLGTGIGSEAQAVNASGATVGVMTVPSVGQHAFLWTTELGLVDLNGAIDASSGWTLTYAYDINGQGQVVGTGTIDGQQHGFLLTPASAPPGPLGPNLSPTAITFPPSDLVTGRRIHFDSGITNSGDTGTSVFNVRWLVDSQDVGAYGSHAGVPAGTTVLDGNSQLDWTFTTPGAHSVTFLVDVDSAVAEQNEADNAITATFTVNAAPPPVIKYAALGDSIASGHGLDTTFVDKRFGRTNTSCQRSKGDTPAHKAYTDLVFEHVHATNPATSYKIACTGDTATALLAIQVPQAEALLGADKALITITIGADNLQFDDPATYLRAFTNYSQYKRTRAAQLATVRRLLTQSLTILGKGKPQRQIIVTGYFNPFNFDSFIYRNVICRAPRTATCRSIVNETVQLLNTAIAGAVADYRGGAGDAVVGLVDGNSTIAAAFLGHESPRPSCGTADPDATGTYIQAKPNSHSVPPKNGNDCFHPNPTGHAELARLVSQLIRSP